MVRLYFDGSRSTIRTDHNLLKWILKLADAPGQLAHWRLLLFKFEFDVVHNAVVKYRAANSISPLQTTDTHTERIENIPVVVIDTNALDCSKMRLEYDQQSIAHVVEGNESIERGLNVSLHRFSSIRQQIRTVVKSSLAKGQQTLSTQLTRTNYSSNSHLLIALSKS